MKQFQLVNEKGNVAAHGVTFPTGVTVIEWTSAFKSINIFDNVDMVKAHSCEGKDLKLQYLSADHDKLQEYELQRNEDFSGVSGTGVVAKGIVFPSGKVMQEWTTYMKSINVYPNIEAVTHIHGHEGRTIVKFL